MADEEKPLTSEEIKRIRTSHARMDAVPWFGKIAAGIAGGLASFEFILKPWIGK